jgi:MFS family permease
MENGSPIRFPRRGPRQPLPAAIVTGLGKLGVASTAAVGQTPDAEAAAWPGQRGRWVAVGLLVVAAILSYTDRQILSLLVDPIRGDLGISDLQIGIIQGMAFAFVYVFAGLPAGYLADTRSRRGVLLAGVAVWSLATIGCGLAAGFGSLVGARIFVGIGEAALAPAATSIIVDLFPPRERGRAIAAFISGMNVGSGVAILIGGAVLTLAKQGLFAAIPVIGTLAPWRLTIILVGLCGLPLLVLLFLGVPEPARRTASAEAMRPARLSVHLGSLAKSIWPLLLGMAFLSIGDFATLSWTPTLLSRNFGATSGQIATSFGVMVLFAGMGGTLVGGYLSDRIGLKRGVGGRILLAAIVALLALPFAFTWLAGTSWQVLALVGGWQAVSAVAGITAMAATLETASDHNRGLAMSLIAFGNISFGFGFGATLTGYLTGHVFHDPLAIGRSLTVLVAPAAVLASLAFLWAYRRLR